MNWKQIRAKIAYMILDALPQDDVVGYAIERLELMTYDAAIESAAGEAEYRREGFEDR